MRLLGLLIGLTLGLAAPSAAASTIVSGTFNFTAAILTPGAPVDPVTGQFSYSFDLEQAYNNDTSVITGFNANIASGNPLYFTNIPGLGFYFGSGFNGLFTAGTNNFRIQILADLSPFDFSYSQVGASEVYTTPYITITPVNQTPIPGAVVMLLTAICGLGGVGFLRRRRVAAI